MTLEDLELWKILPGDVQVMFHTYITQKNDRT